MFFTKFAGVFAASCDQCLETQCLDDDGDGDSSTDDDPYQILKLMLML